MRWALCFRWRARFVCLKATPLAQRILRSVAAAAVLRDHDRFADAFVRSHVPPEKQPKFKKRLEQLCFQLTEMEDVLVFARTPMSFSLEVCT